LPRQPLRRYLRQMDRSNRSSHDGGRHSSFVLNRRHTIDWKSGKGHGKSN
jgi:hypothetical protein